MGNDEYARENGSFGLTTLRGTESNMSLRDTNTLPAKAFYRVRAD